MLHPELLLLTITLRSRWGIFAIVIQAEIKSLNKTAKRDEKAYTLSQSTKWKNDQYYVYAFQHCSNMSWTGCFQEKKISNCITRCEIGMALDSVTEMEKLELKLIYPSICSLQII